MALAYGAVLTLIDLIGRIPAHHARRPALFSEKQLREIELIEEKARIIQDKLEVYSLGLLDSDEARELKRRILDVSSEAANVIETLILDDIEASSSSETKMKKVPLDHVLHNMDGIVKEMVEFEVLHLHNLRSTHSLSSSSSSSTLPPMFDRDSVVGFVDRSIQIMEKLISNQPALQVIPITGMGGIGKTTLAQTVYDNSCIVENFYIRGWVTISQVYVIEQVLLKLLRGFDIKVQEDSEYHDLGLKLYQRLFGHKYLIILDDLWNTEAWDMLRRFLPNTKGSRIIVTTRLNEVANYVGSSNLHEIDLLDEENSWRLLCHKIFGKESCPILELEKVGKEIARSCEGLPLSIVVIGGLLRKSEMTLLSWENVAENVNRIIRSENSNCSEILLLSYKHLPIHLRPCFLYMRVFPEDYDIPVKDLVNLWVAEGFLKPNKFKTLEEVGNEYLRDLHERHLVMKFTKSRDLGGVATFCKVHDLLRDLCIHEADKENFISVNEPRLRFLRVLNWIDNTITDEGYINLLNLRFLRIKLFYKNSDILGLVHRLWSLQTLVIEKFPRGLEFDEVKLLIPIWKMPNLKHLIVRFFRMFVDVPLPGDPVLENLQTLKGIDLDFELFEEVFSRIPNVKVLKLYCWNSGSREYFNSYGHLLKLETLNLRLPHLGRKGVFIEKSVFPDSLKKLVVENPDCSLEEISEKIGWLPNLEKLTIFYEICINMEEDWNPVEGQFLRLRDLRLDDVNLINWNAESFHFPVLEHLYLGYHKISSLKEIPSGIGEIGTLKSIMLDNPNDSVIASAMEILEEQKSYGNEDFSLTINSKKV